MSDYKNRIFDVLVREALEAKGAVLIEDAKWCGKTTTAEQIAKSVVYMNDPKRQEQYFMTAQTHPHENGIGHFRMTSSFSISSNIISISQRSSGNAFRMHFDFTP